MPTGLTDQDCETDSPPPVPEPVAAATARASPRAAGAARGVRRNLRLSLIDGTAFAGMVGIGEWYLGAFVLALGGSQVAAGLMGSVPLMLGAVLQLASPALVRRLGSNRRCTVLTATVQAASFVPLAFAAIAGSIPIVAVFAVAAIYWGAGMAAGSAWITWAQTLVPRPVRARYFARRSRFINAGYLGGFLLGGIILQAAKDYVPAHALHAFAVLFLLAAIGRAVSSAMLWRQSEPALAGGAPGGYRSVPLRELVSRLSHGPDARLLAYMITVQMTVQVSDRFFTPYLLGHRQVEYWQFVIVSSAPFLARMAALPVMGWLAQHLGPRRVLLLGGVGMVPLSLLWIASDWLPYLTGVQFLAGMIWAGYELATFLLMLDTIPPPERTSVISTFNLANAAAMVAGSVLGGAALHWLGEDHHAYMVLFTASFAARCGTLVLLLRLERRPRPLGALGVRDSGFGTRAADSSGGDRLHPIPGLPPLG